MTTTRTKMTISTQTHVASFPPTIFLCDGDLKQGTSLAEHLKSDGFLVRCISHSSPAMVNIVSEKPDVVILDTGLPNLGGFEVCRRVRPVFPGIILFYSSDTTDESQLLAFERGADDFLSKSIGPSVLSARIRVHVRRLENLKQNGTSNGKLVFDHLIIDSARREVYLKKRLVEMSSIQFRVLHYLAERCGEVVSREQIFDALYHEKYNGFERAIDVYVSRIRQKLGDNPDHPYYLKTVRGVGYLFAGRPREYNAH